MSTDVAVPEQYGAEVEALLNQQDDALNEGTLQTPILKVCQSLTKEVKAGDAEAGEFLNTLTSESYGTVVEFIPALFQHGRAASIKDGRYFVAIEQDLIPESWKDLVGEEFVNTRFDEYPDAEEQYKRRVNEGEIEWGKGPLISTTYNYTGLVIPSPLEGEEDAELEPMPVRISFLRSTKSAHDKIKTLKRALLRNKPIWDLVFELSTASKSFGRNDSFIVNVKKSRPTTPEERQYAVELAVAANAGRTNTNDEAAGDGPRVEPDAKGGIAV